MEYAAPQVFAERSDVGFLHRVFAWMALGLAVTGGIAAVIGTNESTSNYLEDNPMLLFGLIILELVVVFGLVFLINKMTAAMAVGAFFFYAVLNGVTLSLIFSVYSSTDIASAFFVAGGMFAAMATIGWVTKRDLSSLGSILFMALIGLILASVVNIFLASDTLYWIVTYAGVAIFAGLTAYDMNKIKQIHESGVDGSSEAGKKQAVMGALALYLDFINLFLFLLRIFGGRS